MTSTAKKADAAWKRLVKRNVQLHGALTGIDEVPDYHDLKRGLEQEGHGRWAQQILTDLRTVAEALGRVPPIPAP